MKENGLLQKPEFENLQKYLQFGKRTDCNEEIIKIAMNINEPSDGFTIRKILLWMN